MINPKEIFNQRFCFILIALVFLLSACTSGKEGMLVSNKEELKAAIKKAKAGDVISLKDGVWKDIEIEFKGEGTEQAPITLQAQTAGSVFLEGQSNIGISGKYLVVSGLVFRNGYTPTSAVIEYRTSDDDLAYNCRVTNCVVDNYSNPERFESDHWVMMYGKSNQFDHNSLIGKRNLGVTFAVRLNSEASQENNHIIEYNYFGPRQNLGSNGGETIRIGTSHYSRTFSNTQVRFNYFDRCDGEHETISNKSCGNVYQSNVFDRVRGTLTMRHGSHTLVENNYFLGRGKANTGGIRIINENQTVRNNYLSGLTGYRFRGALVIMNGIYNSPINRYNQVVDSKMEGNVVVNCDYIQLCAGSDSERTAPPIGSSMSRNIFMSKTNLVPFTAYDDISGIAFEGNYINEEAAAPLETGFTKVKYELTENKEGLLVPSADLLEEIGFGKVKLPVTKEETGASYYSKEDRKENFRTGKTIAVSPGANTLIEAYEQSEAGDMLQLENGADYLITKDFKITKAISILAASGEKAIVKSQKGAFFTIENEGSLDLANLKIDGAQSPDMAGNAVVSTSKYSMNKNYKLFVKDCEVVNLDINHSFNFLKIYRSTMADTILIENSNFKNITGSVLSMAEELEDLGMYNVEHLLMTNNKFEDVQGAVAYIYRGGTDESTYGPIVRVNDNELINCGNGSRNKVNAAFKFLGVQDLEFANSVFTKSAPLELFLTNGEPVSTISDVTFINSGGLKSNSSEYTSSNIKETKN
jgi:poly(beta-D-mannuronate) lyase